jgi:hypothetical protein
LVSCSSAHNNASLNFIYKELSHFFYILIFNNEEVRMGAVYLEDVACTDG